MICPIRDYEPAQTLIRLRKSKGSSRYNGWKHPKVKMVI